MIPCRRLPAHPARLLYCRIAQPEQAHTRDMKPIPLILLLTWLVACSATDREQHFDARRIAHAGGGIDGHTYTNSIEALNHNLARGFRYFEIDLSFTLDGQLVCLHDWERSFKRSFGLEPSGPVTLATFRRLVREHGRYEKCDLDSLARWLAHHPEAYLVTDVKGDNLRALALLQQRIGQAERRVIPQVYQPENLSPVVNMGFEQVIWTLYRYDGDRQAVLAQVRRWLGEHLPARLAVTMPRHRARGTLPRELGLLGIPTYVHTINDVEEMRIFRQQHGVTEIYTDELAPGEAH